MISVGDRVIVKNPDRLGDDLAGRAAIVQKIETFPTGAKRYRLKFNRVSTPRWLAEEDIELAGTCSKTFKKEDLVRYRDTTGLYQVKYVHTTGELTIETAYSENKQVYRCIAPEYLTNVEQPRPPSKEPTDHPPFMTSSGDLF